MSTKTSLKEFFVHALKEGPLDPAFKASPSVKSIAGQDPALAQDAMGGGMQQQPQMDMMSQNTIPTEKGDLDFFSKNVGSAVSKIPMDGFDSGTISEYAAALDSYVYGLYQQIQDPQERVAFEADYQKTAADWSADIVKFFGKLKKLQG
jgi:hypothetical protein